MGGMDEGEFHGQIAQSIEKPPATYFPTYSTWWYPTRHRERSANQLTLEERDEISRGLAANFSIRAIARALSRSPSSISREISRNGGAIKYRASIADQLAWKRGKRPKQCALGSNSKLRKLVAAKITEDWSPSKISGWLKLTYPDDETLRVSHETIYKSLFIQTRGLFRKELRNHLRTKRKFRHSKQHRPGTVGRLLMLYRSATGHQQSKTGWSPGTGKAT